MGSTFFCRLSETTNTSLLLFLLPLVSYVWLVFLSLCFCFYSYLTVYTIPFLSLTRSTMRNQPLKSLIQGLQSFSRGSKDHVSLFSSLTLQDLGFYVSDEAAMKYFQNKAYPLAGEAFLLENALHQCRCEAGPGGRPKFVPFAWKSAREDVLGCSTLFESDAVTLCWFVVPPGRVLPLHDHPNMTVWQRILFGNLHITSIDFDRSDPSGETGVVVHAGEIVGQETGAAGGFTPEEGGGVLHELENREESLPALFIDIISPPYYRAPYNIPCTYYTAQKEGTEKPHPAPVGDSGIIGDVRLGDRVRLLKRAHYTGPSMNAFAHLSAD
ncbi:hypothetical protein STCU_07335 [Strigomonas culicis]|uniref:Cysteamine dioxygenase n=1 Tax=Strigomonas culicis TaxID=28005 RepID=S9TZZ4_9TRYP|nr:hypothetical protein STCU_07335 [Strigomonas culicis]|eukprot:EPY24077.1 hypothetical protein STCU_07335 [Strigomonas culicis]